MNQEFIAIPTEYNCYTGTISNRRLVIVTRSQLYDCKNAETQKRKVFILETVLN